jgi:hypothetical protein
MVERKIVNQWDLLEFLSVGLFVPETLKVGEMLNPSLEVSSEAGNRKDECIEFLRQNRQSSLDIFTHYRAGTTFFSLPKKVDQVDLLFAFGKGSVRVDFFPKGKGYILHIPGTYDVYIKPKVSKEDLIPKWAGSSVYTTLKVI